MCSFRTLLGPLRPFNAELLKLSIQSQSYVLHCQTLVRQSMQEELKDKLLSIWNRLPYSLLGLFDDNLHVAKVRARSCRREWQSAQDKNKVHRVAHAFFAPSAVARLEMDNFCDGPDEQLPQLRVLVFVYNLVSLVGRRIEGDHSSIKHVGRRLTRLPASVSSKTREPYLLSLLRDPGFVAWASAKWYSRWWVRSVLAFKFDRAQLGAWTWSVFWGADISV